MVSTCQQYMITSSVLLWLKSHENLKTLIILQEEISKFAVRFGTYIFIIMNITTLQRINSFSRLQIISLFTICNIVYLTTLQKPFNSGHSFAIHANIIECTHSMFLYLWVLLHCGKSVKFEC